MRKRTVTPLAFVAFPFVLAVWSCVTLVNDLATHRYLHAAFSGVNAVITLYVMLNLHGILATASDVLHDVHDWLYRPVGKEGQKVRPSDWVTVLYHGAGATGETEVGVAVANALAAIDQESDPDSEILFRVHEPASGGVAKAPAPLDERLGSDRRTGAHGRALREHPGPAAGQHTHRQHDARRPQGRPRRRRSRPFGRRKGVNEMETRHRLSPLRLLILVLVVSGMGFAAWTQGSEAYSRITATPSSTWFAPYNDVTLTPEYHFEDPVVSPSLTQVLGFVVADPQNQCNPTWGTYYDLAGAGSALDLDRRITRLRERGGDVVVSFGGAVNDELAVACTNQSALTAAYRSVIKRYHSRTVDFDVEGSALSNTQANERRAPSIATLQDQSGRPPAPCLADASGLAERAVRRRDGARRHHAPRRRHRRRREPHDHGLRRLASLGPVDARRYRERAHGNPEAAERPLPPGRPHLHAAPGLAAHGRHADDRTERRAGRDLLAERRARTRLVRPPDAPCARLDVVGEPRHAVRCAGARPAGVQHVQRRQAAPLAFTWELGRLNGHLPDRVSAPAEADPAHMPTRDNPATSPYPIWRTSKAYKAGDEIVWHQRVYEAKWFTQGDFPDATVAHLWDTPWRYIGPVLASDAQPSTTGAATLLAWNVDQVYLAGNKVLHNGLVYQAKWWTQADEPTDDPQRTDSSPWQVVGKAPATAATSPVITTPTVTPVVASDRREVARSARSRSGARRSSSRRRPSGARSRARR